VLVGPELIEEEVWQGVELGLVREIEKLVDW
jgi:hypothetical protein